MLVAASCTAQEPVAIDPPEPTTTIDREEESPPDSLAFAEPTPIAEQLRLGLTRPQTFLPNEISLLDQNAVIVTDLLYDGLTEADPASDTLRPALASTWTHNEDFTQWSFAIENEAKVKPSAVVAHFQRLISAPPPGTTAFVLGSITSVVVDENAQVVFDLAAPNAGFAWMVSGLQFSILGIDGQPTGRYSIESDTDERMVLDPISDGPRVVIDWSSDEFEAYDKMVLGQLDATVAAPEVVSDAERRYGAELGDLSVSKFFVLNPRSELTATTERRKAFHLAIDQSDMLDGRVPQTVISAPGILARSLSGYSDDECRQICQFDVDEAMQLFDDELKDSTIRVGVIFPDQYGVGEEIAEDLADVGLDTEVVELSNDDLTSAIFDGDVEIFSFGWIAGATSIDAVIPAILGPSSPVEPSVADAEQIEAFLDEAATTGADDDRWALLNQAHSEALSIGMILPISNETHRLVRSPEAKDLPVRADGSIDVHNLG